MNVPVANLSLDQKIELLLNNPINPNVILEGQINPYILISDLIEVNSGSNMTPRQQIELMKQLDHQYKGKLLNGSGPLSKAFRTRYRDIQGQQEILQKVALDIDPYADI
uniref:Uncharacterized protein n=1 Tax=viral metagenome TaxID=1070528 RepID=A0A6C0BKM5_9ZZZZ